MHANLVKGAMRWGIKKSRYLIENIFENVAGVKYRCIFALAFKATPFITIRAISSAGSEHLVYTERVGSSNLSSPTKTTS